ncbi:MAG: hypothetical protein WAS33_04190 [Candidatus Promineifilaceae bacterium]
MKEYAYLLYFPMLVMYIFFGFRWARLGRQFIKGEKQYQPWLKPTEYVNKNVGWHYFLAGILIIIICISVTIGLFFQLFAVNGTTLRAYLETLEAVACLGAPVLLITGVSLYMLRERILQLEPKAAIENENLGQDNV